MFTFALDPQALFAERSRQFAGWGIPWPVIRRMQARITDCWSESPGGWAREWMQEAESAERQRRFLQAALLYGAARFPCVATPLRVQALQGQMACFERATHSMPLRVERRHVALGDPNPGTMPVHLYAPRAGGERPLVLLSGGVDTGKVELHRLACLLAGLGRFRVAAIDMPGTAESGLPLTADAHRVYQGLLAALAPTGRKAVLGVSFGGHWAAKLALLGDVDAAVDLGGPTVVFESGSAFMRSLPNGMPGIIANALGLPGMPDDAEMAALMQPFSLRHQGLLTGQGGAPMLVVNGEHDQYIPQEDSTLFACHARHRVWLMRGMSHCAAEGLVRILPAVLAWLRMRLYGETPAARLASALAEAMLPARLTFASPRQGRPTA
ncbi:MAG: alpha/beta hydrolase [Curvibacter sp.]|nr:alpha/beta hydrolase [Curvibacter sp.]